MKTVTFTEFRSNASELLKMVEQGERLIVLRHGRPIAEVSPVTKEEKAIPSWKRAAPRLKIQGPGLSETIIEQRNERLS